jgi:small subunit ribosomal protein S1
VSGKVKSIVDFGVFVELQGIDGLVPREEVSWDKHPNTAEILKLGNNYKFKVIAIDKEKGRVTLSRRQLKPDPWLKIENDYPKELVVKATVTNLTNHCVYVVLEDGIEGRIHRDNLSWVTSVRKPSDILKKGDAVKGVVLGWDVEKRLLELGLKQISTDPWLQIEKDFPVGSRQTVRVSEVMPYGAFVQLSDTAKGLIHVSDMSWDRQFKDPKKIVKVGDEVEAVVLKLDFDARRINLGMKQLQPDPFVAFVKAHPQGSAVTGTVKNVADFGVFVELAPLVEGLLHISQWAREKVESLESAVKPGEEITAKIIKVDRDKQKISLSRRAFMADEERREVEQYRQNPASASTKLGSLLRGLKIDVNE